MGCQVKEDKKEPAISSIFTKRSGEKKKRKTREFAPMLRLARQVRQHHCSYDVLISPTTPRNMLSRKNKDLRTIKEGVEGKYVKKETPPEMPSTYYHDGDFILSFATSLLLLSSVFSTRTHSSAQFVVLCAKDTFLARTSSRRRKFDFSCFFSRVLYKVYLQVIRKFRLQGRRDARKVQAHKYINRRDIIRSLHARKGIFKFRSEASSRLVSFLVNYRRLYRTSPFYHVISGALKFLSSYF